MFVFRKLQALISDAAAAPVSAAVAAAQQPLVDDVRALLASMEQQQAQASAAAAAGDTASAALREALVAVNATVAAAQQPLISALQPLVTLVHQQAGLGPPAEYVVGMQATQHGAPGEVTAVVAAAQQPLLSSLESLLALLRQQAESAPSSTSSSAAVQDVTRFFTTELTKVNAQLREMTTRAEASDAELARLRGLSTQQWSHELDDAAPSMGGDFSRSLREAPLSALKAIHTRLSLRIKEVQEARNARVVEEHGSIHVFRLVGVGPAVPLLCVDDPEKQAEAHKESEINYKAGYVVEYKDVLTRLNTLESELNALLQETDWTTEMEMKEKEINQLRASMVCVLPLIVCPFLASHLFKTA